MSSKPIFLVVVLAYAEFWLTTTSGAEDTTPIPKPESDLLRVIALPVGQGDCTIIQCPAVHLTEDVFLGGEIIMVDCGSRGGGENKFTPSRIRDFLYSQYVQKITVFITHPDSDHFNYLYRIFPIEGDNVGMINLVDRVIIGGKLDEYKNNYIHNWLEFLQSRNKMEEINGGIECTGRYGNQKCPTKYQQLCSEHTDIRFDILAANHVGHSNSKSIVMKVSVPTLTTHSILLPGDMEGKEANEIARQLGNELKSTVYKMAHHGACCDSNSYTWLDYIKPEMAFASSAYAGEGYRHPRCDTIARLELLGFINFDPSREHMLSCGTSEKDDSNSYKVISKPYYKSIHGTSPSKNEHCELHYHFGLSLQRPPVSMLTNCYKVDSPNTASWLRNMNMNADMQMRIGK